MLKVKLSRQFYNPAISQMWVHWSDFDGVDNENWLILEKEHKLGGNQAQSKSDLAAFVKMAW